MKTCFEIRPSEPIRDAHNLCRSQFSIGGVTIEVLGDRQDVRLVPSLRPFETNLDRSDISISVEWSSDLIPPSEIPSFDSGTTWRCYRDGCGLQFDFHSPAFGIRPYKRLQVDPHFKSATLCMNGAIFENSFIDPEPLEYPLDELLVMHRLTQEHAIELHACGIVRSDGVGNLFVGHSGAGKSTTTRLWTEREAVQVLSDDRIILRPENELPRRKGNGGAGIRMYGTPWHGEAMYASPQSAGLGAIFILEHGLGNTLTELASSEAIAELFARSFVPFHRREYIEAALQFLQKVVAAVPCYRFAFEPNEAAVDAILELGQ
jgi:hypothetical protein